MTKTAKKLEKTLRTTLTQVCETALERYEGFTWITHVFEDKYSNIHKRASDLSIICVFENNQDLACFYANQSRQELNNLISKDLAQVGLHLKDTDQQILYDTEENCQQSHQGDWKARLDQLLTSRRFQQK